MNHKIIPSFKCINLESSSELPHDSLFTECGKDKKSTHTTLLHVRTDHKVIESYIALQ